MTQARIVLLNGVGSAGKSTLARELQKITASPFLHVQMDAFFDMLPAHLQDDPATFRFEALVQDGKPAIAIHSGATGIRLMAGMRRSVAALADAGNDLIVDDVMLGDEMTDYATLLAGQVVYRVGVMTSLDVLEARERQRGDRLIGLARWQYDRVHRGRQYDLTVDTGKDSTADCAQQIKAHFHL